MLFLECARNFLLLPWKEFPPSWLLPPPNPKKSQIRGTGRIPLGLCPQLGKLRHGRVADTSGKTRWKIVEYWNIPPGILWELVPGTAAGSASRWCHSILGKLLGLAHLNWPGKEEIQQIGSISSIFHLNQPRKEKFQQISSISSIFHLDQPGKEEFQQIGSIRCSAPSGIPRIFHSLQLLPCG